MPVSDVGFSSIPLVSVIVLCHDQAGTVARALESVLMQETRFHYEVVIGDDASSDGTRAICEDFQERYPGKVRLLPDCGRLGLVRNYERCFNACRGRYISDCAGDDRWTGTSRLQFAVDIMEKRGEVSVVYSDFRRSVNGVEQQDGAYSSAPYKKWRCGSELKGRDILIDILNHVDALPYILSAAVYKRSAVESVREKCESMVFNDGFGVEDVPVMAALASNGNAVFNPEVTFVYSVGGETLSNSSDRRKMGIFNLKSLSTARQLAQFYGIRLSVLDGIFKSKSQYIASAAFDTGDKTLMKGLLKELQKWPFSPSLKTRLYACGMRCPLIAKTVSFMKDHMA